MKLSYFFKSLSWLIVLNIIVKPLWIFGIDRQVQNIVGHEAYGTYFSILNLSFVLSFIADAGLTNMLNRQIAANEVFPVKKLMLLKCFLALAYCVVVSTVAWISGISRWDILLLICGIQVLTSFLLFFRGIITAHQAFKQDAWVSVLDKSIMIVICGVLIYTPAYSSNFNLFAFLYVQLVCLAMAVAVAFLLAMKYFFQGKASLNYLYLFKKTAPFVVIIFLMSLHNRFDGFLLERLHANGAYEAGVYAAAYRLLDAGSMAGYLAASFLVPFIARNSANKPLMKNVILSLRHILAITSITAVMFVGFFASSIQNILYYAEGGYNSTILIFCIAALPAYFFTHIYGSVLTATGLLHKFIFIIACSVAINMILNLLFVQQYGAMVCCVSAIISQYFCGVACVVSVYRSKSITIEVASFLLYAGVALLLLALFYFGRNEGIYELLLLAIGCGISALGMFAALYKTRKNFLLH